jgi:hypothetical protein
MKLLIIGHGRHGKDTVAEGLVERMPTLSFMSSSMFVAQTVVRKDLEAVGINYLDLEDCYEDRVNHRDFWRDSVARYCNPPERMAQEILADHDIYVGMRTRREFAASRHLFDEVIWVDRTRLLPPEPSCELTRWDATYYFNNNNGKEDLVHELDDLQDYLERKYDAF